MKKTYMTPSVTESNVVRETRTNSGVIGEAFNQLPLGASGVGYHL